MGRSPYDNYVVLGPDGNEMFYSDAKKFNWYLKKNLAKRIDDYTIQLTFTPKGKGEQKKYLHPKVNICVVSGVTENLSKHHIIPSQYRKLFPNRYKTNNSKDVVLLERRVHDLYEMEADKLKEKLLKDNLTESEINFNKNLNTCKKIIRSLNSYSELIPSDKFVSLYNIIEECLIEINKNVDKNVDISNVDDIEPIDENQLVIERVGIENLIVLWNNHFLEVAKPKYMPESWDPNDIKIVIKD